MAGGARQCRESKNSVQPLVSAALVQPQNSTHIIVNAALAQRLAIPNGTLAFKRAKAAGNGQVKTGSNSVGLQGDERSRSGRLKSMTACQLYQPGFIPPGEVLQFCIRMAQVDCAPVSSLLAVLISYREPGASDILGVESDTLMSSRPITRSGYRSINPGKKAAAWSTRCSGY